jgi:ribonuclease D
MASREGGYYIGFVVQSDQALHEFLPALSAADWVAVDTEADSLHAYPEKLCLIQISTSSGEMLVDPLGRL